MMKQNIVLIIAAVAALSTGTAAKYFVLRHEELASLSLDVESGGKPAAGKSLAIRRRVAGLSLRIDEKTKSVRTASGDLCIQEQGGTLKLAACDGTNDWRFYSDRSIYVSGLVHGGSTGGRPSEIAVWKSDADIYTAGANIPLVSKPYEQFKNDYGAEWIQKPVSLRKRVASEMLSLLRDDGTAAKYFVLRHEELASLSIDVENGGEPAAGKSLAIRRRVAGLSLRIDEKTKSVRTASGDLCIQEQGGTLKLAACDGSNDWRFYSDRSIYVSGLVHGGSTGSRPSKIAVWKSDSDIYTAGANIPLVSKPYEQFKNDYGAEWIQKPVSLRRFVASEMLSLLREDAVAAIEPPMIKVSADEQAKFVISHVEYRPMVVSVEGGGTPAVGKALSIRYEEDPLSAGIQWYEDEAAGSVLKTVNGNLCVIEGDDAVLRFAQCSDGSTNEQFRYYSDGTGRVRGIVLGPDNDIRRIASWDETKKVNRREEARLLAKPFETYKRKFSTKYSKRPI